MMQLLKAIRTIYDQVPNPPARKPVVIQFPINDICNSRCQMCNIWRQKQGKEISPSELRMVLSDSLFSEVIAVGVNGGEPTLRKDIGEVVQVLIESLPKLKSIFLITNGIRYSQVTSAITELASLASASGVNLDVMVSLDGMGAVHDLIRGKEGNFESAVRVINFAKQNSDVANVRIGCTIMHDNVYGIEGVLDWAIQNDVYATFRVAVPHRRLYNDGFPHPSHLNEEERFYLANFLDQLRHFYEQDFSRKEFYRSLRDQLIYDRPRTVGCDFKNRGVTLTSEGKLSYCAVESKELGDAITLSPSKLYWGNVAHLKEIQENKCDYCYHDYGGTMSSVPVGVRLRSVFVDQLIRQPVIKAYSWIAPTLPKAVRKTAKMVLQSVYYYRTRRSELKQASQQAVKHKDRLRRAIETSTDPSGLPNRILLTGWYGTETLGDKAILAGVIQSLRTVFSGEIDLASIEPYVSIETCRQMPELKISEVLTLDVAKSKMRAGEYRGVVIAGGPLMSTISYCADLRDLFLEAREKKAATVIAGCGVGPLESPAFRQEIEQIFQLSSQILLRDHLSVELATKMFDRFDHSKLSMLLDPAFIWLKSQRERCLAVKESKSTRILLALRDWPIQEYGLKFDRSKAEVIKREFESQVLLFVKKVAKEAGSNAILPFCMHKYAVGGDDRLFYKQLFRQAPKFLQHLDMRNRTPEEDLKTFLSATAALTMRFHSTVFAIGTSTPFLAIDYTLGGKVKGILKELNGLDRMESILSWDGNKNAERLLESPSPLPFPEAMVQKGENQLSQAFSEQLTLGN